MNGDKNQEKVFIKDPENMLKGDMAQSLVENLLRGAGNQVYRFGYESILQNLTQVNKVFDRYSDVGEQIRSIPDFLIVNKDGKPFLVEVKFRWQPVWHNDDFKKMERIDHFWKAKIIFVNCSEKPYFRISEPPYIDEQKKLISKPLFEDTNFGLKDSAIESGMFDNLVEKYLSVTLNKNKTK